MRKTKEPEKNNENKILMFISKEDAKEFEQIAKGRKFCRKGERIVDICDEEIKRYKFEHYSNLFEKIFKRHKYNKKKEKLLLENRVSSIVRAIAINIINNCGDEEINRDEIILKVKKYILNAVEEYNKDISKAS